MSNAAVAHVDSSEAGADDAVNSIVKVEPVDIGDAAADASKFSVDSFVKMEAVEMKVEPDLGATSH